MTHVCGDNSGNQWYNQQPGPQLSLNNCTLYVQSPDLLQYWIKTVGQNSFIYFYSLTKIEIKAGLQSGSLRITVSLYFICPVLQCDLPPLRPHWTGDLKARTLTTGPPHLLSLQLVIFVSCYLKPENFEFHSSNLVSCLSSVFS